MKNEYREAVAETLEVMKYLDDELLNKIPLEVIKKLKSQKSETYINKFDKEIEPSKLSDKAINLLAVIYREYIANEEEKIEFDRMLDENDLKGDGKDYTLKRFEQNDSEEEENLPVLVKKSFLKRLFEKIFRFNKSN